MLVNPISFRLSSSVYWSSTWNIFNNENYKYLFYSDLVFFEFFIFFFRKVLKVNQLDIYSSHIRLIRQWDKIIINLYYHVSNERYLNDLMFLYKEKKNEDINNYIRKKEENYNLKKIIKNILYYINLLLKKNLYNKKNWYKIKNYIKKFVNKNQKIYILLKKKIKKIFYRILIAFLELKKLKDIKILKKKKLILKKKKKKKLLYRKLYKKY